MKKIKLALDLHGTITDAPEFFCTLSKILVDSGNEVHVLTGHEKNEKLIERIKNCGISYTHLFSIVDYCRSQGNEVSYTDEDNPWISEDNWDRAKAEYCLLNSIDLCIDDSEEYSKYFSTPFALYKSNKNYCNIK